MNRDAQIAGCASLMIFVASAAIFGAMLGQDSGGFSHRTHPLAWMGAGSVPRAMLFNLCTFVLPGVLAAVALWPLRPALPPGTRWSARIGSQMVVLSALAFAAQGVLPLDLENPDGTAGGLHAVAWTAWWLAFSAGALTLAWGLRYMAAMRRGFVAITALTGLVIPMLAVLAPLWLPNALAQRMAFVLWFVWVAWAAGCPRSQRSAAD
jgi:hypothetical membrane protein